MHEAIPLSIILIFTLHAYYQVGIKITAHFPAPLSLRNSKNSITKSAMSEIANSGRKIARPIVIATTAKPTRLGIAGGAPNTESGLRLRHKMNLLKA